VTFWLKKVFVKWVFFSQAIREMDKKSENELNLMHFIYQYSANFYINQLKPHGYKPDHLMSFLDLKSYSLSNINTGFAWFAYDNEKQTEPKKKS
jgi:hypothetical protein